MLTKKDWGQLLGLLMMLAGIVFIIVAFFIINGHCKLSATIVTIGLGLAMSGGAVHRDSQAGRREKSALRKIVDQVFR